MKIKSIKSNALLIVIVIFLMANFAMTLMLLSKPTVECQFSVKPKALSCEAMPIKFALDNPDCANKLLMAMNVTNVKVLPQNSTNMLVQEVRTHLHNYSMG